MTLHPTFSAQRRKIVARLQVREVGHAYQAPSKGPLAPGTCRWTPPLPRSSLNLAQIPGPARHRDQVRDRKEGADPSTYLSMTWYQVYKTVWGPEYIARSKSRQLYDRLRVSFETICILVTDVYISIINLKFAAQHQHIL